MIASVDDYYYYGSHHITTSNTAGGVSGWVPSSPSPSPSPSSSPSVAPDMVSGAVRHFIEETFHIEVVGISNICNSHLYHFEFFNGASINLPEEFIKFLENEFSSRRTINDIRLKELTIRESGGLPANAELSSHGTPDSCCDNEKSVSEPERKFSDELIKDLEKAQKSIFEDLFKKDKHKSSLSKVYQHRRLKNKIEKEVI